MVARTGSVTHPTCEDPAAKREGWGGGGGVYTPAANWGEEKDESSSRPSLANPLSPASRRSNPSKEMNSTIYALIFFG